jgi:hypothetical protein
LVFISAYTCIDQDHNTQPYEGTIRCRLQKDILHDSAHTAERKWQTANRPDLLAQVQSPYLHFNQDLKKKFTGQSHADPENKAPISKLKEWLILDTTQVQSAKGDNHTKVNSHPWYGWEEHTRSRKHISPTSLSAGRDLLAIKYRSR